jgi:hypothetical protein
MSFDQMNRHQVSKEEIKADAERISRERQSQQIQDVLDTINRNQTQMDQNRQKKVTTDFNTKNRNKSADQFNAQNQRLTKIRSNPAVMLGQMAGKPMAYADMGIASNIFGAAAAPGHSIGLYQKQLRMQEAKAQAKQLGAAGKAYRASQMFNTALAMGSSGSYLGAAMGLKIPSLRGKMTQGLGEAVGFSGDKFVGGGKAGANLLSGQWGQSAGDIASNVGLGGIGQSIGSSAGSVVGGIGGAMSPAMLAGIALPIAMSIATSMWKGKKQARLRGEPPVVSDIIQRYSRTKGIMQQTMLLLRSGEVKPGEALMIQVGKITADNTGALLAMYEIMKMEEEHKTKDAVTSVDLMDDGFKDKGLIEGGFDKIEAGFQKFSMKYNPLAQLGAAIGGKTPKQVMDEITGGQQKDVNFKNSSKNC